MEAVKIKLGIQQTADQIKTSYSDFKKDLVSRKNQKYREQKLQELEEAGQKIDDLFDQLNEKPDEALQKLRDEIKLQYVGYETALLQIPDDPLNSDNEDQRNNDNKNPADDEIIRKLEAQEIRFESITNIYDQVIDKLRKNEAFSGAWCHVKIDLIKTYFERLSLIHEEIATKVTSPRRNKQIVDEKYIDTMITLQEKMESKNNREGLKLPRIEIQKFGGDYFDWVCFRDLFQASVIDHKNLIDAQRMQLLKSHLEGEAKDLIKDLTLTNNDFNTAWARLKDRFENEKVIVQQYLKKLTSQPNLKPDSNDSQQLKKLLDTTEQILASLESLNRPVEHWDDWIVMTIRHKLNDASRREWEKKVAPMKTLPTWADMSKFLEEEYRIQESLETRHKKKSNDKEQKINQICINQTSIESAPSCPSCNGQHSIFKCNKFKSMAVDERWNIMTNKKLCFKCLIRHDKWPCNKENACRNCKKNHHTWLHRDNKNVPAKNSSKEKANEISTNIAIIESNDNNTTKEIVVAGMQSSNVLLATALVTVINDHGQKWLLRAVIDFGSQGSLITTSAAQLLNLTPVHNNTVILPVGGSTSINAKTVTITVQPRFESPFKLTVECHCLQKIMKPLPEEAFLVNWKHLKGLKWADPNFNETGPIDLLLGTENIDQLMKTGLRKGEIGEPIAQNTELGWVMSGRLNYPNKNNRIRCSNVMTTMKEELNDLRKFWELEDLTPDQDLTADEIKCNDIYDTTYKRNDQGHFTVCIPFKNDSLSPENLGESRPQAMARFLQLESKLKKNDDLRLEYIRVMEEYISLGHMIEIDDQVPTKYYIPHHAVIKPDSLTTKTRVVFDASAKTTNGLSLNDCMYTGEKQQDDLFVILTRWRTKKIAFKADIEKMYRQIDLTENDRHYHTVFWRNDPTLPVKEYQLTTVTFGTAAAPYLATRTLNQIANDGNQTHPIGSKIIERDFYVDDLISGTETIEEALTAKNEIIFLLKNGKMNLRKWTSNSQEFLKNLPTEDTEKSLQVFKNNENSKTLGRQWNPKTDTFSFKVSWEATLNKPQETYWNGRTLRARQLKNLLWVALIAIMIILGGGSCSVTDKQTPIEIKKFYHQPGIYFEDLGQAKMMTTKWHIYLNIELDQYYNGISDLNSILNDAKMLCQDAYHCKEIMDNLPSRIDGLRQMEKFMQTNREHKKKRSAPLAVVGWVDHELFGVMNEDNAAEINDQFARVALNEKHLMTLIKNQTSLLDITASIMKETEAEVTQQYEQINAIVSNITKATAQAEDLLGLALYLDLILKKFENLETDLINMITDMHQGHVNPRLFTPESFLWHLDQINGNLPTGTSIPINPRENLNKLYKLLRGKSRIAHRKILFDITLPLVSSIELQVFHVIPVPTIHGDHRIVISPDSEVLLITLERDKFYQLNWNEYLACVDISDSTKMCPLNHQMFHTQSNQSRCERELLNREAELSLFCQFKLTNADDVWIKLQQGNKWIYDVKEKLTVTVMCRNQINPVTLEGNGLIKLSAGCSLVQPEMTIIAREHKFSEGTYNFNPNMNLSTIATKLKIPTLNFTINHSHQLNQIHEKLTEMRKQTNFETIQHYAHFSSHSLLWLIFVIILLLIWIKRHVLKKLWLLLSKYMVTSSNHLIASSWQHGNIRRLTASARSINENRSIPPSSARGENVRSRHTDTI